MSSYIVPQDVEAEDKILGPFSFRQFIYLLITFGMVGLTVLVFNFFPIILIVTLPIALFFLVLALPLRKDQSMEVYLGAVINYFIHSRNKKWEADNITNIIEFTNIINEKDEISLKNLSREEAIDRISFLSNVVDTGGWSIRGVNSGSFLQDDVLDNIQQINDVQDDPSRINSLEQKLNNHNDQYIDQITNQVQNQINNQVYQNLQPYSYSQNQSINKFPYQTNSCQTNPFSNQHKPDVLPTNLSQSDIIDLANNKDLSVEGIASVATQIQQNKSDNVLGGQDQIEIKLR